ADQHDGRVERPQHPSYAPQRLPETLPSACFRRVRPEEGGQLVPRVEPPGGKSQISEKRVALPCRQTEGLPVVMTGAEPSQEVEAQSAGHQRGKQYQAPPLRGLRLRRDEEVSERLTR